MTEHCIICGAEIPEGRQVCVDCEKRTLEYDDKWVTVEDVLETIRDMAHHPDHVFVAKYLIDTLEWRLKKLRRCNNDWCEL